MASFVDGAHGSDPEPVKHLVIADYKIRKLSLGDGFSLVSGEFARHFEKLGERGAISGLGARSQLLQTVVALLSRPQTAGIQISNELLARYSLSSRAVSESHNDRTSFQLMMPA